MAQSKEQAALLLKQIGVSAGTLMQELGFDDVDEQHKFEEEAPLQGNAAQPQMSGGMNDGEG